MSENVRGARFPNGFHRSTVHGNAMAKAAKGRCPFPALHSSRSEFPLEALVLGSTWLDFWVTTVDGGKIETHWGIQWIPGFWDLANTDIQKMGFHGIS